MSQTKISNKENFRLLDLSSDEESEDLHLEIIPRKKKMTRRDRSRGPTKVVETPLRTEIHTALQWAVRGTLMLWLISLTWTCATLYEQVLSMNMKIVKVSTSSEGVDDALQLCHTAARQLRANASELAIRLTKLEQQHLELSKRVDEASGELAAVSEQLAAAPKLADTPRRLAELQRTVADFGSQINGFDSALKSAHKQATTATTGVEEVRTLLHDLELRTNDTITNVTANAKRNDQLTERVDAVNSTLTARVQELQTRIEVSQRTTSAPSPPTTAAPPAPSAAPAIPASTTTLSPDPPGKPNVTKYVQ